MEKWNPGSEAEDQDALGKGWATKVPLPAYAGNSMKRVDSEFWIPQIRLSWDQDRAFPGASGKGGLDFEEEATHVGASQIRAGLYHGRTDGADRSGAFRGTAIGYGIIGMAKGR
jgi:hypothetical protein